jgi:hypothetical protein
MPRRQTGGKFRDMTIAHSYRGDIVVRCYRIALAIRWNGAVRRGCGSEGDRECLAGTRVDRTEIVPLQGTGRAGDVRQDGRRDIGQFGGIVGILERPFRDGVGSIGSEVRRVASGDAETNAVDIKIARLAIAGRAISSERGVRGYSALDGADDESCGA